MSVKQALLQLQLLAPLNYANCISVTNIAFDTVNVNTLIINNWTIITIDDYIVNNNDSVILSGQTNTKDNGIYIVTYVIDAILQIPVCKFDRRDDYNWIGDMKWNRIITVKNGTLNGNWIWLTASNVTVIGTDPVIFVKTSVSPTNLSTTTDTNSITINSSTGTPANIPIITNNGNPGLMSDTLLTKLNNSLQKDGD